MLIFNIHAIGTGGYSEMRSWQLYATVVFFFYVPIYGVEASWLDDLKKAGNAIGKNIVETVDGVSKDLQKTNDSDDVTNSNASKATVIAPSNNKKVYNSDKKLVLSTQKELKRLGYQIVADGAYGPGTRNTILKFQKSKNIPQTGNVSPELFQVLKTSPGSIKTATSQKPENPVQSPEEELQSSSDETAKNPITNNSPTEQSTGFIISGDIRDLTNSEAEITVAPNALNVHATMGHVIFKFKSEKTDKGESFSYKRTRISMLYADLCSQNSTNTLVTLRVLDVEVKLLPGRTIGKHCLLASEGGNKSTGLIAAVNKAGYIDFRVNPLLLKDRYDGWHRISQNKISSLETVKKAPTTQPKLATQLASEAVSSDIRNDPVFQACNVSTTTSHYNCACMVNPPEKQKNLMISTEKKNRLKSNQAYLDRAKFGLKIAIDRGDSDKQIESAKINRDNLLEQRAEIKNLSWESYETSPKMLDITNRGFCKNEAGARKYQLEYCKKYSNTSNIKIPAGQSVEKYCGCISKNYAKSWLEENRPYNSKVRYKLMLLSDRSCS